MSEGHLSSPHHCYYSLCVCVCAGLYEVRRCSNDSSCVEKVFDRKEREGSIFRFEYFLFLFLFLFFLIYLFIYLFLFFVYTQVIGYKKKNVVVVVVVIDAVV